MSLLPKLIRMSSYHYAPTRRLFLGHLPCVWGALSLGCNGSSRQEYWISAASQNDGEPGVAWTSEAGDTLSVDLDFRAHDLVVHPQRPDRVVVVARHPGQHMVEIDLVERRIVREVRSQPSHAFGGHVCFSADGSVLFSTEADYQRGVGRIVVRDATDYRVLDDFPSHGIGPHELQLMPDGQSLAVANGGLLTHPDSGSRVLNLDNMRSTLAFIDARSGELLDEFTVAEPKASIRHLDVCDTGEVAVALQLQRAASGHERLGPLAAVYRAESGLEVLAQPEALLSLCKDYMGSTRINPQSRTVGYTSPRGDIALFWNLDSRAFAAYHRFHDVCGLTVSLDRRSFVLSNSAGQLRALDAASLVEQSSLREERPGLHWDNHLRAILA